MQHVNCLSLQQYIWSLVLYYNLGNEVTPCQRARRSHRSDPDIVTSSGEIVLFSISGEIYPVTKSGVTKSGSDLQFSSDYSLRHQYKLECCLVLIYGLVERGMPGNTGP
eukprot:sb/3477370/